MNIHPRKATAELLPFHVKDKEARTILISKRTLDALATWQAKQPEGVPLVLLTGKRWETVRNRWRLCRAGEPWKLDRKTGSLVFAEWQNGDLANNVRRNLRNHAHRAGIELTHPLTTHTLRKSYGQNHADAGTPIHVLQKLMGHASITTTRQYYLQATDANDVAALQRMDAIMSSGRSTDTKGTQTALAGVASPDEAP